MTRTIIAVALAASLAACATSGKPRTDGVCALPLAEQSAAIAEGSGPWSHANISRIDDQIARYVAENPARTVGWERPKVMPTYYVWDCVTGLWQKHQAQARRSGAISMIWAHAHSTGNDTLAVAIHERAHQWQPGRLESPEMEAAAQHAEKTIMAWGTLSATKVAVR